MKRWYQLGAVLTALLFTAATAYAQPACPAQPSNADGTTITSPAADQAVTSPVTVKGAYFGSFEGVVPIRILGANGAVLVEASANNECCVLSPYERKISFSVSAPTPACVVVYRESGADGSLTMLAQVPVTLTPGAGLPPTGAGAASPLLLLALAALALAAGGLLWRGASVRPSAG